jgi:hypothetical protein
LSKNSGNNCRVLFFKKKEEDKTSKQKKIGMKVRRYQSGKPSIEAGQTIKWSKEKRPKDKQ